MRPADAVTELTTNSISALDSPFQKLPITKNFRLVSPQVLKKNCPRKSLQNNHFGAFLVSGHNFEILKFSVKRSIHNVVPLNCFVIYAKFHRPD